MTNKKFFIISVFLLLFGATSAQQNSQAISLEEAINFTFDSNPTIAALQAEQKAAHRERQAAIGLYMPKISVKGAYSYLGDDVKIDLNSAKDPIKGAAGQIIGTIAQDPNLGPLLGGYMPQIQQGLGALLGLDWAYTLQQRSFGFIGADVTMPIFMGGKIVAANRAAKIKEGEVAEQCEQKKNQLLSEVVERYYGYSLALNVIDVRKQVLKGMEQHLHDIKVLEENGMVAATERLYVEFKLAEAERELQNAQLQSQTISSALSNTLGGDKEYLPITSMFVINNIEGVDYYKSVAQDSNPLLGQVESKRKLAKQNVNVNRADFFPQIVAMGGGMFCNHQVTKMVPRWAIGVGFNFKIFDGLRREYKYYSARNTLAQVEAVQTKAKEDISVLVENLYNQMQTYNNQFVSIESSIKFAEEYLRAKNKAYLEGMGTATDLIDAELNLAKVRIERMQVAYKYDLALAKLLEAAGISNEYLNYSKRTDAQQIMYDNK